MARENMTRYAVLGLLTTTCRTGYDMKQMIDRSLNHFWKISFGQVYPMLRTLEVEGLIEQEPGDERKSYRLTSSGHDALRRWIAEEPDALPVQRNELLLKLFFARHDTLEQTLTKIRHHERLLRERLDTYEAIETTIQANDPDSPDAVYWLLTLDYGKRQTYALIDWCEAAVCTLKGGDENGTENGRPK